MRRTQPQPASTAVELKLVFDRWMVEDVDRAGRLLGLSREAVLTQGFKLLTDYVAHKCGHFDHSPGSRTRS